MPSLQGTLPVRQFCKHAGGDAFLCHGSCAGESMSPKLEIVQRIMFRYAELYAAEYRESWIPKNDHIRETLDLLDPPLGMPGLTESDLMARLGVFFRCKDSWLVSTRHNYSLFTKHIHRWISTRREEKKNTQSTPLITERCGDCNTELKSGQICPTCYPICDKCGKQHSPQESCEEWADRMGRIKNIFSQDNDHRSGKPASLGSVLGGGS